MQWPFLTWSQDVEFLENNKKEQVMKSYFGRRVRAAVLVLGILATGGVSIATATAAGASPASSTHSAMPMGCRYGCY